MPRDITVTFEDGSSHVYKGAPDSLSPEEVTARASSEFQKTVTAIDGGRKSSETAPSPAILPEIGRVLDKTLRGGVTALPGMVGDALAGGNAWAARKLGLLPDTPQFTMGAEGGPRWPSDALAAATGGPISQPQTRVGRALGNIGEGVVSAFAGPGGFTKQALALGLGSGLGGEAAAALTDDNAITRIIGSLVGGGAVAGIPKLIPLNAKDVIRTATEKMTPTDWANAYKTQAAANELKIPSISSQFLGPRSTLDDVVREASANQFVRPKLLSHIAGIPEASKRAVTTFMDSTLPPAFDSTKTALRDVQQTAIDTINASKKADQAAWGAAYNEALAGLKGKAGKALEAAKAKAAQAKANLDAATQARAAGEQALAQEIARREAAQNVPIPLPGMQGHTGRLLTPPEVGAHMTNQLATHAAQKAMAEGKGVIVGPNGQPLSTLPPLPEVPTIPQQTLGALAAAEKGVRSAQAGVRAVTQVPESALLQVDDYLANLAQEYVNTGKVPLINALRSGLRSGEGFITDGMKLNDILKSQSNAIQSATRSQNPINAGDAKFMQGVISGLRDQLGKAFEPIREGNAAWLARRQGTTQPMQQGLVGQLAQLGGGLKPDRAAARTAALDAVFPRDIAQGKEIKAMAKQMGAEPVGELLRENLTRALQTTMQLGKAAEPGQPFGFLQKVAGTSAQRENVYTALSEYAKATGADPSAVRRGVMKLFRALESTKDIKIAEGINTSSVQQETGKNIASVAFSPFSRPNQFFWNKVTARTYRDIVDMITTPERLKELEAIGRSPKPSVVQPLLRSVLQQAAAPQQGE